MLEVRNSDCSNSNATSNWIPQRTSWNANARFCISIKQQPLCFYFFSTSFLFVLLPLSFIFSSAPSESRECRLINHSGHRALPVARSTIQTHSYGRVQEQRFSDLAAKCTRGRSRHHLLHYWSLQVSFTRPEHSQREVQLTLTHIQLGEIGFLFTNC